MKIGIYGYGNLGRGAELAAAARRDTQIVGIFTARDPRQIGTQSGAPVYPASAAASFRERIDVMLNCGGSKTDLPQSTPLLARQFHVVDSFDAHEAIPAHFAKVDAAARQSGHAALIAAGWDPGLFSLFRAYACGLCPNAAVETFWGPGVSQGHTQALKSIPGVRDAVQFTMPVEERQRAFTETGESLPAVSLHQRVCYVNAAPEDQQRILREILSMPQYFAGYDTRVFFVSAEALRKKKTAAHGGNVLAMLKTGGGTRHFAQFRLSLGSNPEFTGAVLVGFAHALYVLSGLGETGAKTVFDLPPSLFFSEKKDGTGFRFL